MGSVLGWDSSFFRVLWNSSLYFFFNVILLTNQQSMWKHKYWHISYWHEWLNISNSSTNCTSCGGEGGVVPLGPYRPPSPPPASVQPHRLFLELCVFCACILQWALEEGDGEAWTMTFDPFSTLPLVSWQVPRLLSFLCYWGSIFWAVTEREREISPSSLQQ